MLRKKNPTRPSPLTISKINEILETMSMKIMHGLCIAKIWLVDGRNSDANIFSEEVHDSGLLFHVLPESS